MTESDIMTEWKNNLPLEIENNLQIIIDICGKINSFDLLSYISFTNHLHNAETYTDDRGDKHFFVSETIACQCLKNNYIEESSITNEEVLESFEKLQQVTLSYCAMIDAYNMFNDGGREDISSEILSKIKSESKNIRNPGHPRHHLMFSEELLKPFEDKIETIFGFTLEDTIIIRKGIAEFLQTKYEDCLKSVEEETKLYYKQTIKYKNSKISSNQLQIDVDNIEDIIKLSDSEIRRVFKTHFLSKLLVNSSKFGSFSSTELSDFFNLDEKKIQNFLNRFSCTFQEIGINDNIYQPISILKQKPFVNYNDRYIIPSLPLLIWVVEEEIEKEFKKDSKLFGKFIKQKHDFLLNKSENYFKSLLPQAKFLKNMFYGSDETLFETDGLIIFNDYLFIVEAKANKLSSKAKS